MQLAASTCYMIIGVHQLEGTSISAGLPEEMAIVKTAVARSYVPIAFSSSDETNRCWDAQWLDKSLDIPNVRQQHPTCLPDCLSILLPPV